MQKKLTSGAVRCQSNSMKIPLPLQNRISLRTSGSTQDPTIPGCNPSEHLHYPQSLGRTETSDDQRLKFNTRLRVALSGRRPVSSKTAMAKLNLLRGRKRRRLPGRC